MPGFTQNEWIARSPQEVFSLLTDPAQVPTWLPTVQRLEPLGDGPVAAGARLRETRRVMGQDAQAELEIVAYRSPVHYAVRNITSGVETTYAYDLHLDADGTRIRLAGHVRGAGARRLSAFLLARLLAWQDRRHLVQLKHAAERSPTPDPASPRD